MGRVFALLEFPRPTINAVIAIEADPSPIHASAATFDDELDCAVVNGSLVPTALCGFLAPSTCKHGVPGVAEIHFDRRTGRRRAALGGDVLPSALEDEVVLAAGDPLPATRWLVAVTAVPDTRDVGTAPPQPSANRVSPRGGENQDPSRDSPHRQRQDLGSSTPPIASLIGHPCEERAQRRENDGYRAGR